MKPSKNYSNKNNGDAENNTDENTAKTAGSEDRNSIGGTSDLSSADSDTERKQDVVEDRTSTAGVSTLF